MLDRLGPETALQRRQRPQMQRLLELEQLERPLRFCAGRPEAVEFEKAGALALCHLHESSCLAGRGATMHDGVHMAELTLDRDNIAEIPPHCSPAIVFGVVLANTFDPTQQQLPSDISSWAVRCDTGNSIVRRCGRQAISKRALNRPTRCGDRLRLRIDLDRHSNKRGTIGAYLNDDWQGTFAFSLPVGKERYEWFVSFYSKSSASIR